jgi:hypothetical protein
MFEDDVYQIGRSFYVFTVKTLGVTMYRCLLSKILMSLMVLHNNSGRYEPNIQTSVFVPPFPSPRPSHAAGPHIPLLRYHKITRSTAA